MIFTKGDVGKRIVVELPAKWIRKCNETLRHGFMYPKKMHGVIFYIRPWDESIIFQPDDFPRMSVDAKNCKFE